MANEADTCRTLVIPKLQEAGWESEPHSIAEQRIFTDGRIVVRGNRTERRNGCNLDRKNPRAKEDITHLPPEQLAASILKKEQRIAEIMGNIRNLLAKNGK
jgi:hypothetical protein